MTLEVGAEGIGVNDSLEQAFPTIDPGMTPLGARIILQLKSTANKTSSGILLVDDTKDTEKWNVQTARVISLGPLAFRNRDTGSLWTEGQWVEEGDYVRISRWDGDRFYVPDPNDWVVCEKGKDIPTTPHPNCPLNDIPTIDENLKRIAELEVALKFFTMLNEEHYKDIAGGIKKAKEITK